MSPPITSAPTPILRQPCIATTPSFIFFRISPHRCKSDGSVHKATAARRSGTTVDRISDRLVFLYPNAAANPSYRQEIHYYRIHSRGTATSLTRSQNDRGGHRRVIRALSQETA